MNRAVITCMILLGLTACVGPSGYDGEDGRDGTDGESCLVETLEDGVYISCPDSDAFIPYPAEQDEEDEAAVYCERGKGHKKHTHDKHELCEQ